MNLRYATWACLVLHSGFAGGGDKAKLSWSDPTLKAMCPVKVSLKEEGDGKVVVILSNEGKGVVAVSSKPSARSARSTDRSGREIASGGSTVTASPSTLPHRVLLPGAGFSLVELRMGEHGAAKVEYDFSLGILASEGSGYRLAELKIVLTEPPAKAPAAKNVQEPRTETSKARTGSQ